MIAAGTLSGGLTQVISGGNFLKGVTQGFAVSLLNHALHNGKSSNEKEPLEVTEEELLKLKIALSKVDGVKPTGKEVVKAIHKFLSKYNNATIDGDIVRKVFGSRGTYATKNLESIIINEGSISLKFNGITEFTKKIVKVKFDEIINLSYTSSTSAIEFTEVSGITPSILVPVRPKAIIVKQNGITIKTPFPIPNMFLNF